VYQYNRSTKSDYSDELINSYLLRPLANLIVWAVYKTPVTPNQLTIAAILAGLGAAVFYLSGTQRATAWAGVLILVKDILDSADGQLARAKNQFSRRGRFLDSIGDFIVNAAVFGAIGWALNRASGSLLISFAAFAGFIGITLRVSYHVFYQTSYLHLQKRYAGNRTNEEITNEDRRQDALTVSMQRVYLALYGWQDRLMAGVDRWCRGNVVHESQQERWYDDRKGLLISGFLGFGTELTVLMLCSVLNALELYLVLNIVVMNGVLVLAVVYRRFLLRRMLEAQATRRTEEERVS
jgi:phosphatidylglycerophosphate synthase